MIPGQAKKTVVLGVLGVDAHVVGNKIMAHALESAGFKVVNIGTFSSQEDFIRAAIESAADALLVGSLCGHGEMECREFRKNVSSPGSAISIWSPGETSSWASRSGKRCRRVFSRWVSTAPTRPVFRPGR